MESCICLPKVHVLLPLDGPGTLKKNIDKKTKKLKEEKINNSFRKNMVSNVFLVLLSNGHTKEK